MDKKEVRKIAFWESIRVNTFQWLIIFLLVIAVSYATATTITQNKITNSEIDYTVKGTITDITPLLSEISVESYNNYGGGTSFMDVTGWTAFNDQDWDTYSTINVTHYIPAANAQYATPGFYLKFNFSKEVVVDSIFYKYGTSINTFPTNETNVVLTSSADAVVVQSSPSINYGTETTMDIGYNSTSDKQIILSFDLSSIPASATINSATLSMYKANGNTGSGDVRNVSVYKNTVGWTEGGVTWNAKPTHAASASSIAYITEFWTGGVWYSWDVAADVQNMIGGGNTGWTIEDDVLSNAWATFRTREGTNLCAIGVGYPADPVTGCGGLMGQPPTAPKLTVRYSTVDAGTTTSISIGTMYADVYSFTNETSAAYTEVASFGSLPSNIYSGSAEVTRRRGGLLTGGGYAVGNIVKGIVLDSYQRCNQSGSGFCSGLALNSQMVTKFYEIRIMGYELD